MSVKVQARLIFLGMFLATFACGTLAGRLCIHFGIPSLVIRNGVAIICSYVSFLLMMWFYVRAVRADPVFLRRAVAEGLDDSGGTTKSGGWWESGSWVADSDGWLLLVVALALVVLVGAWIGMEGPALLIDEASAAAIAAGLAGRAVFLLDESWFVRVLRRTAIPIVIYLALSSIVMGYADVHCPGRLKLTQVVKECVMARGGR